MSEMPMFDDPIAQEAPASPKKPRRKPVRKTATRKVVAAPAPKKRRAKKRRTLRVDMKNSQFKTMPKGEVLLSQTEFNATLAMLNLLRSLDPSLRHRVLKRVQENMP